MKILSYDYEEFVEIVKNFHNYPAPGVIVGGFMVDLAVKQLDDGVLFDAVCETKSCLPDSIQLLTPCTIGNGWLKVFDLNLYALALYDKNTGKGVRVFLDARKLDDWTEIQKWLYKLVPKMEQDPVLLASQIRDAGSNICSFYHVEIKPEIVKKRHKGRISDCPACGEPFPAGDGEICRRCQGDTPYT